MRRALLLGALLAGCGQTKTEARPGASAEPPASATAPAASASASAAPAWDLRPPAAEASRAEREKAALDLLGGRARAAELPLADVDPGEPFEPHLRYAMTTPMDIRIGAITPAEDEKVIRAAVEGRRMRLRVCYSGGLRDNPNLQGRVVARVIAPAAGKPLRVENAGSDMPDSRVVTCALAVLGRIDFPAPREAEGVSMVPVMFSPY